MKAELTKNLPRLGSRQRGMSLIEVMAAVLLLSIGLLGIMGMQTRALQYNQQAYIYSQANFLIQDIAEKMRANRGSASQYITGLEDTASTAAVDKCITAACNDSDLAGWDVKLWKDAVARSLPQGKAAIDNVGSEYEITIEFDDSRGEEDPIQVTRVIQI